MTVNVMNHGALADGTNDVKAIQAAIDAAVADADHEVLFPAGTYSVRGTISGDTPLLILHSGITLKGEGPSSCISCEVERTGSPTIPYSERAYLFYGSGVSDITVRGLRMESTKILTTAVDEAIHFLGTDGGECRNITVEACEFEGFRVAAFASRGGRRTDSSGVLSSLRIVDCNICTIGRMAGGGEDVVFGVGINANGWDGAYIARNHIENVGIVRYHWGIYCNLTRFATVVDNTIIDCSGGIAWTGIETAFGQEAVTISHNTIDLARNLDDDWDPDPDEAPFSDERRGLQLRGNNGNTPLQVGVIGNRLRASNIQVSGKNVVITANDVNLEGLKNEAGIVVGVWGWDAQNVTVSENTIRAASAPDDMTTGILVSSGTNVRVVRNSIEGTAIGIGIGVDKDPESPIGRVVNCEIDRNTMSLTSSTTAIKNYCFFINGAENITATDNVCEAAGFKRHAVQIGDNNRPRENRAVWIASNEFRYLGGAATDPGVGGVTFGVGVPPEGAPLPRFLRLENNRSEFPIISWPPNCPKGWRYTVFEAGDILRANSLVDSGLDEAVTYSDRCGRSSLLHGADNVKRALRAHEIGGHTAYSVLGGHTFTAPLGTSCPWHVGTVCGTDPSAPAGADDASEIAFLADGFVGQEVAIRAEGGSVCVKDRSDEPKGNIRLKDDESWHMDDGESVTLVRLADRWQEVDRAEVS